MPEVWEAIITDAMLGVQRCTDPDCDWCEEARADGTPIPFDINPRHILTTPATKKGAPQA